MGDLLLHPTKGVNPRLTICPRCGGEARELILVGARDMATTCPSCKTVNFGARRSEPCGKCGTRMHNGSSRKNDDYEKLPGGLCEACEKEVAEHRAEVDKGGVYFKCKGCGAHGVVKHSVKIAAKVRQHTGIKKGPVGIEFETCPQCEAQAKEGD